MISAICIPRFLDSNIVLPGDDIKSSCAELKKMGISDSLGYALVDGRWHECAVLVGEGEVHIYEEAGKDGNDAQRRD